MPRPRVLISAFSCNPERGSEPGVGHFFVSALAKYCDLTVITEEVENRAAIERRRREDKTYAGIDFRYIQWPAIDRHGRRIDDRGSLHFYRNLRKWERAAMGLAMGLSVDRPFEMTHHLTMQGYREPGFLWQLPLPFVWGPVGGHAQIPWKFFPMLGWRGMLKQGARNIGNAIQARHHARVRTAARAAAAVITNTSAERDAFAQLYGVKASVIAEIGCDPIHGPERGPVVGRPFKIAWSGVHLPRKGLPILLHALARLPQAVRVETHILSDGPETGRWQALASQIGVGDRCIWHGRLPRSKAIALMAGCDAFALTSLLDGTSCVLNEAIACGLPVICHRACGFPDVVNDTCGILVPLKSPQESAAAFADAIARLALDGRLYQSLCDGARNRIHEISAAQRAGQMLEVYERVLNRRLLDRPASPVSIATVTA